MYFKKDGLDFFFFSLKTLFKESAISTPVPSEKRARCFLELGLMAQPSRGMFNGRPRNEAENSPPVGPRRCHPGAIEVGSHQLRAPPLSAETCFRGWVGARPRACFGTSINTLFLNTLHCIEGGLSTHFLGTRSTLKGSTRALPCLGPLPFCFLHLFFFSAKKGAVLEITCKP